MTVRPPSAALAVLALVPVLAAAVPARGAGTASELPPAECVRMLRSARIAALAGDPARELELLRAAVEEFPGEVSALYALIDHGRRHPLAADEHQRLVARLREHLADPARPLSAGVVHQIARDPAADEQSLRALAEGVGRRLEGAEGEEAARWLAVLAQLQHRLGERDAAASTMERLWRLEPSDDVGWTLLQLYFELERKDDALALMDASAGLRDASPLRYIHLLIDGGRYPEAIRRTEERLPAAGTVDRLAAGVAAGVAWRLRDAGRDQEAEALFRRAAALDPEDPKAEELLLHLYADPEERRAQAAAAARRWQQEEDAQSLLDEGTQRLAAGDAAGALELLERAAPQFPDHEPAWFNLGMAAYRAERWPTVDRAFARAVELNPEREASFFFRGLALVQLGRCREAIAPLARSLELDPGRYQAHYYLAGCHTELGDAAAAARHRAAYDAAKPR